MAGRAIWDDAAGIDRRAAGHLRPRHRNVLGELITSVPLADGVRLAKRYADLFPADHRDAPLLARLTAADEESVMTVTATAADASRSVHPLVTGAAEWLSFGVDAPVLTLTDHEADGRTRVALLSDGSWRDVYLGELHHHAVACVDEENVVAVRDEPGKGRALVHYRRGDTVHVSHGRALTGMRPAGTAAGFVAGAALSPAAAVAGPQLGPGFADLSPFGIDTAHRLAVSPDGGAVAFGGSTDIVVLDARLERLIARTVLPVPHGPVRELTFTGAGELVACGMDGGLSRWRTEPHEALVLAAVGKAPMLTGLYAVPAWGVLVADVGGEARHRFFDPVTLGPADWPRPLMPLRDRPGVLRTVAASANGRFAAVGRLVAGKGFALTVHDFHHPLARLLRPVGSLTAEDHTALGLVLGESGQLGPGERAVLELLEAAAAHRLRAT
ncbi:hypothetical protein GCM10011583_22410 [Streptomyces camponoticapitis]|uniref:WD40 repeat domain-containing protein n=1 Tax=Streptomyces camponoticapitis TaxID=1616125 RepID=A0ABQ2E5D0_9ACTN|nr:hypothetical protein [Streptomyces camponoticapitis]GGJ90512.1 hypothetical protein GCM10011583_22410 [Streptomyces camponoticapitis]